MNEKKEKKKVVFIKLKKAKLTHFLINPLFSIFVHKCHIWQLVLVY